MVYTVKLVISLTFQIACTLNLRISVETATTVFIVFVAASGCCAMKISIYPQTELDIRPRAHQAGKQYPYDLQY